MLSRLHGRTVTLFQLEAQKFQGYNGRTKLPGAEQ